MPYIPQKLREDLDNGAPPLSAGELNYAITKLCVEYAFATIRPSNYSTFNEVIGVLECAKQEFYRRIVVLYEDEKKELNGDVYNE